MCPESRNQQFKVYSHGKLIVEPDEPREEPAAMRSAPAMTLEEAEVIGLRALAFLAEDEARLSRFLALTGLTGEELSMRAADTATLCAVLDHLAGDESMLLVFTASASLPPERIGPASELLASRAEGT